MISIQNFGSSEVEILVVNCPFRCLIHFPIQIENFGVALAWGVAPRKGCAYTLRTRTIGIVGYFRFISASLIECLYEILTGSTA